MLRYWRCRPGVGAILLLVLLFLLAGPVSAAEQAAPDPLVAKVYQQEIHLSQLQPRERFREVRRTRLGEDLYAQWLDHFRRLRLKKMIVAALLESFGREQRIVANKEETAAYAAYLDDLVSRQLEKLRQDLAELDGRLGGEKLSAERREGLVRKRQNLQLFIDRISSTDRGEDGKKAAAPGYEMAALQKLVQRWKTEQALYQRYGGDVLCSVARTTPVGAQQALVDERLATYAVTIVDPDFLDLQDDFHIERDPEAFVMPRRLADRYYAKPWWMRRGGG